jgi:hypothetical protein
MALDLLARFIEIIHFFSFSVLTVDKAAATDVTSEELRNFCRVRRHGWVTRGLNCAKYPVHHKNI